MLLECACDGVRRGRPTRPARPRLTTAKHTDRQPDLYRPSRCCACTHGALRP
ncbi:hypothetical protein XMIN_3946 [Xanthomonas citri pv. mangiferaeindicae LMG 941]|nr:hypothetical protein XMIN_3946 [Xanthomonas citri pv. mangiferaeindicae LMG 941]